MVADSDISSPLVVPDFEAVSDALLRGLQRTYERHGAMIDESTNERSILFHVGRYVAEEVAAWGGPWRVDLEYNRIHGLFGVSAKWLDLGGAVDQRVYPDLIIHDPSTSSPVANLLVVEAKKNADVNERDWDTKKLLGFLNELSYRYAAYIELVPDVPRWKWVQKADQDDTGRAAVPVWKS